MLLRKSEERLPSVVKMIFLTIRADRVEIVARIGRGILSSTVSLPTLYFSRKNVSVFPCDRLRIASSANLAAASALTLCSKYPETG